MKKEIELKCIFHQLKYHYHKSGTRTPWISVRPRYMIDSIFQEIENRCNEIDEWMRGTPSIGPVSNQGVEAYRLALDGL